MLRGVNLEIEEGSRIAIVGASGAGKSTLLHILGTLERPDFGSLHFGPTGQNLCDLSTQGLSEFRNRMLGFIFQFHHLLPEFTALENIMMPGLIAGKGRKEVESNARELLDFIGLKERAEHKPSELSGGEQQRVAIARAIVMKPRIILADEMTGNLDSQNAEKIMQMMLYLNETLKLTLILVTHDSAVAQKMQQIRTMRDGLLVD